METKFGPDWQQSKWILAVIGILLLLACALQLCSGASIGLWGSVVGSGIGAYVGLLLLATLAPFMLKIASLKLSESAGVGRIGTSLMLLGLLWAVSFLMYFAMIVGGMAPVGGALLHGKQWILALLLGSSWLVGVLLPAEAPAFKHYVLIGKVSGLPNSVLVVLGIVYIVFFAIVVPIFASQTYVQPPVGDTLTLASYNVQQGFTLDGFPNTDCVVAALDTMGADWVGLSESNAAHFITENNDVSLSYASKLHMNYFRGAPDSLPSVDIAMISRFEFKDLWTSSLQILEGCDACPTQTHLWAGANIEFQGMQVQVQVVHTEWFSNPSTQINYIAQQIRERFMDGPLVLVGDFNSPQENTTRPYTTALRNLTVGTGLQATCGDCLDEDVQLPLPATEWISDLHLDWIFYRGLELVNTEILNVTCSDHKPVSATFRLPSNVTA